MPTLPGNFTNKIGLVSRWAEKFTSMLRNVKPLELAPSCAVFALCSKKTRVIYSRPLTYINNLRIFEI